MRTLGLSPLNFEPYKILCQPGTKPQTPDKNVLAANHDEFYVGTPNHPALRTQARNIDKTTVALWCRTTPSAFGVHPTKKGAQQQTPFETTRRNQNKTLMLYASLSKTLRAAPNMRRGELFSHYLFLPAFLHVPPLPRACMLTYVGMVPPLA